MSDNSPTVKESLTPPKWTFLCADGSVVPQNCVPIEKIIIDAPMPAADSNPGNRTGKYAALLREMKVGHSIVVPSTALSNIYAWGKRNSRKFRVRSNSNGTTQVWVLKIDNGEGGRREQKSFTDTFGDGCEFWTSEDGMLMSLVIMEQDGWQKKLQDNFRHVFAVEDFDEKRGLLRYAYREWAGSEFFDGPQAVGQRRGKLWRTGEEPTPYRVIQYDLKLPR